MRKTKSGFTIVELIVVIVVIAIIATITAVAYNGAQDRAKNSQTLAAASQWLKALQIYKVRNGGLPNMTSCLGGNYTYNSDGAGSSGIGQCRQDTSSVGVTTNAAFYTALKPYIAGNPTPAMITAMNTTTSWYRGLYYYIGAGNNARLDFVFTASSGGCPAQLDGIKQNTQGTTTDGDYLCTYIIGNTVGYQ